ncbi:MAG: hypothetical protein H0V43_01750 [Gemmatimonadales bacterium]|nr:hypothetical protein [Gemmatimonadales bacterium]MBA3553795.1 hypothetical protein [Gemmatimonadales bacterium]
MRAQLERDFERFGRDLPRDFAGYVRERYRIDLSARYLGFSLPHPVGKGSGQLSLKQDQLEADRDAGLAFVVLKTVIAEDSAGERSMGAWAIHETRMKVERQPSAGGRDGWTVTWKGRGWDRPFEEYLALVRSAADLTHSGSLVAVPSVKYHLPALGEPFREAEYAHTTEALMRAWGREPLPLEKDFSPTLAGDHLADEQTQILRWLREVPNQIRAGAGSARVRLALKLMNARHDDDFQLRMIEAAGDADALVVFNRLWSVDRAVAYGGHDLSDRNLRVLAALRGRVARHPPLTGTGNVCSGRILLEYARLGCESVQLHTLFQLPLSEYPATSGTRQQRALHLLFFHPTEGVVGGMLDLEAAGELSRVGGELRFLDLCRSAGD